MVYWRFESHEEEKKTLPWNEVWEVEEEAMLLELGQYKKDYEEAMYKTRTEFYKDKN